MRAFAAPIRRAWRARRRDASRAVAAPSHPPSDPPSADASSSFARLSTTPSSSAVGDAPGGLAAFVASVPSAFCAQTSASGRGLYASRAIAEGETLARSAPLVAHPTLDNLAKSCYHCLTPLVQRDAMAQDGWVPTHGGGDAGGAAGYFCSRACASDAWSKYHAVETAASKAWAPLVRHCVQHGLKFPLLAARLACEIVAGASPARLCDPLVRVNLPSGVAPEDWIEEHQMIRVALARGLAFDRARGGALGKDPRALARLADVGADWYVGVVSRMHLNAFRAEILPEAAASDASSAAASDASSDASEASRAHHHHGHSHDGEACAGVSGGCDHDHGRAGETTRVASPAAGCPSSSSDFRSAMEAALASSALGAGQGTALYGGPSLLNHSCDPNVDAVWVSGDATLTLRARRAIEEKEELTITYGDAEQPVTTRRERLRHAYGFTCACERCVEESELRGGA